MDLDLNLVRSITTVLAFVAFIGICWWAYRGKSRAGFDEAARLPLDDDPVNDPARPVSGERN